MSSAITRVTPDLLEALAIVSDIIFRRSGVDQEDLKPYWKYEKKTIFFLVINKPII